MLNKTPLLHQSFGPRVFFLSLSFRLILWSTEALWVHFPAWAFKILSRRCSAPSPLREGAWGLCEQSKPHVRDFTGFLRKPRNISLFLSPLLSYRRLQTTRFQSIKGPQHETITTFKVINISITSEKEMAMQSSILAWKNQNLTDRVAWQATVHKVAKELDTT